MAVSAGMPADNALSGPSVPDMAEARPGRGRAGRDDGSEMTQMTVEQRIIIRVPMLRRVPGPGGGHDGPREGFRDGRGDRFGGNGPPPPPPEDMEWHEHKGPKCVPVRMFAGATLVSGRSVDFLMRDRTRLRARLSRDCQAADLYAGFYVQRQPDGALCADRDSLLARSGASCEIESFKRLVPEEP